MLSYGSRSKTWKIKKLYMEGHNPPDVSEVHFIQVYTDAVAPVNVDASSNQSTPPIRSDSSHFSIACPAYQSLVSTSFTRSRRIALWPQGILKTGSTSNCATAYGTI